MTMSPEEQLALLSSGTAEILPDADALLERLRLGAREGRPLRIKQGFDPTAPDIHLGHTVGLRKLRQFQDLGHQVVLIVGDYTGMVGDPSGRSKVRPQLTQQQVEDHARTYLEQFFRVLDREPAPPRLPVEVHRNGEWFAAMDFMSVMRLAKSSRSRIRATVYCEARRMTPMKSITENHSPLRCTSTGRRGGAGSGSSTRKNCSR